MNRFRVKSYLKNTNKKRSSRACAGCHCRKVRCDVTSTGFPCTSCSFYDIPCSIPMDRRGKSGRATKKGSVEAEISSESLTESNDVGTRDSTESSDLKPEYWMEARQRNLEAVDESILSSRRPVNWEMLLPGYASPLSTSITRRDSNVLQKEGAFDVPHSNVRDELLRNYVQYVHPALPILHLEDFLMVIDDSYTGKKGISFLLFQAVMFTATAFESAESLAIDGFRNRREARKIRFDRVKMLYTFGCEDDRVTILQAILLMTYWDDSSYDGGHDAWHFVSVAKALLRSIQVAPTDSETELFQQKPGLWRRIYWSCYMRDRLVAIAMRRPVQLDESDFEVDMLRPSDLYVGPLSTKCCLGTDGSHPAIRDPSVRSLLSQITIHLVQCCRCIGRVLHCKYTRTRAQNELVFSSVESLVPKLSPPTDAEVLLRDSELEEWYRSLPKDLSWSSSNPLHGISKHGNVILLFRSMLNGLYSLASIALHRRQLSEPKLGHSEVTELSKRRVHDAATTITRIYDFCIFKNPNPLLSDNQVAIIESSMVTNLGDLQSFCPFTRQLAVDQFQTCARALQHLSNTYPSADVALACVDAAAQDKTRVASIGINPYDNKHEEMHDTFKNGDEARYQSLDLTRSQQLDNLELSQTSELLCSHFMMTSFERSLLQDLLSPGEEPRVTASDDCDSSPGQHSQSLGTPSNHGSPFLVNYSFDSSPVQNAEETEDSLIWGFEPNRLTPQPLFVDDGFESQSKDAMQSVDDWAFFEMMSQYCME